MNQGTTASWLLAHTTMYCGMVTEHMSYYSAKAHAQPKEEASPNDCTFLVIHQAFAVTYLNCQREKSINKTPSGHYISTLWMSCRTLLFISYDKGKVSRAVVSIHKSSISMVLNTLIDLCVYISPESFGANPLTLTGID